MRKQEWWEFPRVLGEVTKVIWYMLRDSNGDSNLMKGAERVRLAGHLRDSEYKG